MRGGYQIIDLKNYPDTGTVVPGLYNRLSRCKKPLKVRLYNTDNYLSGFYCGLTKGGQGFYVKGELYVVTSDDNYKNFYKE